MAATEQARDNALLAANAASDNTERVLANEEARLLAHLSELSTLHQRWVDQRQVQLTGFRSLLGHFGADGSAPLWSPDDAAARYVELRD